MSWLGLDWSSWSAVILLGVVGGLAGEGAATVAATS